MNYIDYHARSLTKIFNFFLNFPRNLPFQNHFVQVIYLPVLNTHRMCSKFEKMILSKLKNKIFMHFKTIN